MTRRMRIMNKKRIEYRKRLFEIIEVGNSLDRVSRCYDFLNVATIIINLIVSILYTYDNVREEYGGRHLHCLQ